MKAFTSIEQSKKLAKILPFKSADMSYTAIIEEYSYPQKIKEYKLTVKDECFNPRYDIPCWSLAAIIELLPYDIKGHNLAIHKSYCPNEKNFAYELSYEGNFYDYEPSILVSTSSIELIDACVEMIEKLKEKGLI